MEHYQALINEILYASPKGNYEYLKSLRQDSADLYVLKNGMATLLRGLMDTPDTATVGHIRSIIESCMKVYLPAAYKDWKETKEEIPA